MPYRSDVAYLYDGSFEGLLCCVYESYRQKELPLLIICRDEEQATLFPIKEIITEPDHARKVALSIRKSISDEAMRLVRTCYFSQMKDRETAILSFLRLGYKAGPDVVNMLTHEAVSPIMKSVLNVSRESNYYKEFLRFSESDGALVAVIEPKNFVLPMITPHYCDRFPDERFLIYDKSHKYAFIHEGGKNHLFPLESLKLPEVSEREAMYRALWKRFYDTIAVTGRINHKLRMSNMPKRYWAHMTEFFDPMQPSRTDS